VPPQAATTRLDKQASAPSARIAAFVIPLLTGRSIAPLRTSIKYNAEERLAHQRQICKCAMH